MLPRPGAHHRRGPRPGRAPVPRHGGPGDARGRRHLRRAGRAGGGRGRAAGRGGAGGRRPGGRRPPQRARHRGRHLGLRPGRAGLRGPVHPPGPRPVGVHAVPLGGDASPSASPEFVDGLRAAAAEAGLPADRVRDVGDHLTGRRRPWRGDAVPFPDEDATYGVIYTSGTTGRPKASQVVHRGTMHSAIAYVRTLALTAGDRTAIVFPLYYVTGHVAQVTPDDAGGGHVGDGGRGRAPGVRPAHRPAPYHLPDGGPLDLAPAPARPRLRLARAGPRRDRRLRRLAGAHLHRRRPPPADAPAPPVRRLRAHRDPLAGHHPPRLGVPPEAGLGGPAAAVRRGPGGRRRRPRRGRRRGGRAVDPGPDGDAGLLRRRRRHRRRHHRRLAAHAATTPGSTTRATCSSSTARRT